MKNLVIFLYFVFLFKIAFAQSLPSLPGLNGGEGDNLIPEYVAVPEMEDVNNEPSPFDDMPEFGEAPSFDAPSFDLPESETADNFPSLGGDWQDAPPPPGAINGDDIPEIESVEIDQFQANDIENSANDGFSNELEVDDNFQNVTIDNLLDEDLEIEVSKDQFPDTPSLGGFTIGRSSENKSAESGFDTKDINKKEEEVLNALFQGQDTDVKYETISLENRKSNSATGVDRLNDFAADNIKRAPHSPVTYSEDQLTEHLIKAAAAGNRDAVLALLHSGRNANATNKFGETPLMSSINNGNNSITEILLAEGANPNATDNRGNTPIHVAVSKSNYFAVEKLIKAGALVDPRNRANDTPLLIATLNNSLDIVDLLIRTGADVNKSNDDGLTPLHIATFNNNIEVVKYLLYVGANANMINREGLKPYDLAYGRNLDMARLLAGYTGKQQFVSNDLPNLIQQQNNMNQNLAPNTYGQQFNLLPASFNENNQPTRQNQTAWWGAQQTAQQNVIPVQSAEVYTPTPPQQQFQQPQYSQQAETQLEQLYTQPTQQASYTGENQTNDFENLGYEMLSENRRKTARLSNVDKISNNYAPTQMPKNIISKNIGFMGMSGKPKSDSFKGNEYSGLPTPKSMIEAPIRNTQPMQQQVYAQPSNYGNSNYNTGNPYNNIVPTNAQTNLNVAPANTTTTNQRILKYSEMPYNKKNSWDRNLEKWLIASSKISQFTETEKQVWEKQRAILQSVYQEDFKNSVEQTKRRIIAQQRSSIEMYGTNKPVFDNKINQGLTGKDLNNALKTSYLKRSGNPAI